VNRCEPLGFPERCQQCYPRRVRIKQKREWTDRYVFERVKAQIGNESLTASTGHNKLDNTKSWNRANPARSSDSAQESHSQQVPPCHRGQKRDTSSRDEYSENGD